MGNAYDRASRVPRSGAPMFRLTIIGRDTNKICDGERIFFDQAGRQFDPRSKIASSFHGVRSILDRGRLSSYPRGVACNENDEVIAD